MVHHIAPAGCTTSITGCWTAQRSHSQQLTCYSGRSHTGSSSGSVAGPPQYSLVLCALSCPTLGPVNNNNHTLNLYKGDKKGKLLKIFLMVCNAYKFQNFPCDVLRPQLLVLHHHSTSQACVLVPFIQLLIWKFFLSQSNKMYNELCCNYTVLFCFIPHRI